MRRIRLDHLDLGAGMRPPIALATRHGIARGMPCLLYTSRCV
ncbi:hypothetical protein [Burkholderia gladioli]|nr:hypothetical protein [Burkholderia gladioli]